MPISKVTVVFKRSQWKPRFPSINMTFSRTIKVKCVDTYRTENCTRSIFSGLALERMNDFIMHIVVVVEKSTREYVRRALEKSIQFYTRRL